MPLILGGNDDVYVGRRITLRVLSPLDPFELAGLAGTDAQAPEPGSSAERRAARALTEAFAARVAADVLDVHLGAMPPPGTRKRGRFMTTLFR